MEIVIDMTDDIYAELTKTGENEINLGILLALREAVRQGTTLPKGHGRLIDADETIQRICGLSCGCTVEECGYEVPCFSVRRINSAPTIIDKEQES